MANELRYGIMKYNRKENSFIFIDKNRTMIYYSTVGFIDLKALSLKDELEREDINKVIEYMKSLMINATDRNVFNHDNHQFYFNKFLTLNDIEIHNVVLTKEKVKGKGIKRLSTIGGIISSGLLIFNSIYPNMLPRNAGAIATGASTMLNRVSTLVNDGYGEDQGVDTACGELSMSTGGSRSGYINLRSSYTNSETWAKPNSQSDYTDLRSGFAHIIHKLVTPIEKIQKNI